MYDGKNEEEKTILTEAIKQEAMTFIGAIRDNVSVSVQNIEKEYWLEKVYNCLHKI